jgi:signal transduction histidine kinase
VLTGALAAVTVIPTAIPLSARLEAAQEAETLRHVARVAQVAGGLYQDAALLPGSTDRLGVAHLSVHANSGATLEVQGATLDVDVLRAACQAPPTPQFVVLSDGRRWGTACAWSSDTMTIAATPPEVRPVSRQVFFLVFFLSVIVGIVTALGVLRILSPLNRVSEAMRRISGGERAVRVEETGFAELDAIIEQVNATSQAVDDRHDAIVGRIHVVQEMARLVAHEVRNPLQALELLTSLVASEDDPAERTELAQRIHEEIRGLDNVVTRLLREGATTGALRARTSPRQLRSIIEHVVALRQPEARSRGITISTKQLTDTKLDLDGVLISRSIENIVANAMSVVPPQTGVIVLSMREGGEHVEVIVEDNGTGIPEHLAPHVFDANVSGGGGTGLGLALVKGVMDAHGGYVRHDKSPLGGARFICGLPVRPKESAQ